MQVLCRADTEALRKAPRASGGSRWLEGPIYRREWDRRSPNFVCEVFSEVRHPLNHRQYRAEDAPGSTIH